MEKKVNILIIGAGPAGLATGYYLQKQGSDFLILEKGSHPGFSFQKMHKSMHLLTPIFFSHLPNLNFPGRYNHYPHHKDFLDYLKRYQKKFELPVRLNALVEKVEKKRDGFFVKTSDGDYFSKVVIVASGLFSYPFVPPVPGLKSAKVPIIHSGKYKTTESIKGDRVLIVGGGNTAIELAIELCEAGRKVSLSVLGGLKALPHFVLGLDIHFFSRPLEKMTRLMKRWLGLLIGPKETPVIGQIILKYIKKGQIKLYSGLKGWEGHHAVFDKERVEFDAAVLATGYRYRADFLGDLVKHDRAGNVVPDSVEGLFFVGIPGQGGADSCFIRGIVRDAKLVARSAVKFMG